MKNDINLIIHKFIEGDATSKELSTLKHWISEDKNKVSFENSIELKYLLDSKFKTYNVKNAMDKFNTSIEDAPPVLPKKYKYLKSFLKYAAVFIGLIGIVLFFEKESNSPEKLIIEEETITLKLSNGKIETIVDFGEKKILNKHGKVIGQQEGSKLDYSKNTKSNTSKNDNKLIYNKLNVPYGKTFQLILSDGTQVYLNSGTTLKYPTQFLKGENRQVFLKGEAFFNVAKNVDNPFVVNADSLNIKVVGTQFNVSSYVEDAGISIVLVEGSVGLYEKDEDYNSENITFLKPDEKGTWNKIQRNISVEKVDTDIYTGWIGGKLIFKNTPFRVIRKKLERHYNVTIKNNDKILDENTYNAVFDIENIEKVLQTLNESYPIEYTIINNQIQIN